MKHAINPREWNFKEEEITDIWIAEDLLTMSTHVFTPEDYTKHSLLYNNKPLYTKTPLQTVAQDIRERIGQTMPEKEYQHLTILYAQIMEQLQK